MIDPSDATQVLSHLQQAEGIVQQFTTYTRENPVIGGACALWLLGSSTYLLRSLPNKLWAFFVRHATVTMSINNSDELFYYMTRWLEDLGIAARSRTLKAHNGKWGQSKSEITAGYGRHWFFHKKNLFLLSIVQETTGGFGKEIKEILQITAINRSQKPLRNIIKELKDREEKIIGTRIHRWAKSEWTFSHIQPVRRMDSIFLPKIKMNQLLKTIKDFEDSRNFYTSNGIPYHLGIALYGIPGSGKTSLVKALCGHLNRNLYIMNLGMMGDESLQIALEKAGSKAIVLIEDADTYAAVKARKTVLKKELERKNDSIEEAKAELGISEPENENNIFDSILTLSGILNAIDGATSANGRILVMTTNDIEKLDPAIRRKGRIDLELKFECLVEETFKEMLKRLYPSYSLPKMEFKNNVSPAELQALVLENRNDPNKVLKTIQKPTKELFH